jgi:predicted HicB family RNase H-like nuclease
MSSTLHHRGYEGSVQYSSEDRMLHGRLLCARDMVIFGGIDLDDLEKNFRDAVDEYLRFCAETGKTPDTPSPLAVDVFLKSDLQMQAIRFAEQHRQQLDTVVNDALEQYLTRAN